MKFFINIFDTLISKYRLKRFEWRKNSLASVIEEIMAHNINRLDLKVDNLYKKMQEINNIDPHIEKLDKKIKKINAKQQINCLKYAVISLMEAIEHPDDAEKLKNIEKWRANLTKKRGKE